MRREALTKKLHRIINTIESGDTPIPVRKLWVFGSYARGALDCGDLDLAIVVDHPSKEWLNDNIGHGWILEQMAKFQQQIKNSLGKRGERIEIVIETKDESILDFFKGVPITDALLIWSEDELDWQTKIESIKADPNASRFKRSYPINLKRTGTSRDTMEKVLWLVNQKRLKMKSLDLNVIEPQLSRNQSKKLQFWRSNSFYGKETMEVLPYAFEWLRLEKKRLPKYLFSATEIKSVSGSHFIHIGKINFDYALGWMYSYKKARKLCLIPHLRKRSSKEMFVIERGPKWSGDLSADLQNKI